MSAPPTDVPVSPGLRMLDEHAFSAATEPYRRELRVHCYRMLGSVQEAEDAAQETLWRAWRRRETFEGRGTLRAWLYRIATNYCLDVLKQRPRRSLPSAREAASAAEQPIPASINEPIWLEPFPDDPLAPEAETPEARYAVRESVALAFITALHLLPTRQRAVLILRDVLEWPASEVAEALGQTVGSVKSALHRARQTLARHPHGLPAPPADDVLRAQLERYVSAWETADVDGLVALLTEEATFSMPPIPAWYRGRGEIARLVGKTIFSGPARGRWRLLPTRANGQPAFGLYKLNENTGGHDAYGVQVVTFSGAHIADIMTCRNPAIVAFFNLPVSLPPQNR
jgi:RNA polymerase sigma-70 factor (ECF subfamily)